MSISIKLTFGNMESGEETYGDENVGFIALETEAVTATTATTTLVADYGEKHIETQTVTQAAESQNFNGPGLDAARPYVFINEDTETGDAGDEEAGEAEEEEEEELSPDTSPAEIQNGVLHGKVKVFYYSIYNNVILTTFTVCFKKCFVKNNIIGDRLLWNCSLCALLPKRSKKLPRRTNYRRKYAMQYRHNILTIYLLTF